MWTVFEILAPSKHPHDSLQSGTNASIFSGGEGERSAPRLRYIGKRIMKLMGLDLGRNRTPFQNLTDAEEVAIKSELQAIGFFDRCNVL